MISWFGRLWVGSFLGRVLSLFPFGDPWCLRLGIPFARSLRRFVETFVFLIVWTSGFWAWPSM